ncbi:MAG: hypothetical protein IJ729_00780 [Alloprevotella sp.]|nr:hypothetical protein [Alloprevotella sp.]
MRQKEDFLLAKRRKRQTSVRFFTLGIAKSEYAPPELLKAGKKSKNIFAKQRKTSIFAKIAFLGE